jgi:hypothetical protein
MRAHRAGSQPLLTSRNYVPCDRVWPESGRTQPDTGQTVEGPGATQPRRDVSNATPAPARCLCRRDVYVSPSPALNPPRINPGPDPPRTGGASGPAEGADHRYATAPRRGGAGPEALESTPDWRRRRVGGAAGGVA